MRCKQFEQQQVVLGGHRPEQISTGDGRKFVSSELRRFNYVGFVAEAFGAIISAGAGGTAVLRLHGYRCSGEATMIFGKGWVEQERCQR